MALNDVIYIKGKGGLGRPLTGKDHYSGLVFYSNTLPSGFSTTDRIKQIFSTDEAETLGITESLFPAFNYHISEFFRINEQGVLYISINAVPAGAYTFTEVTDLQNYANGDIRQFGVFTTKVFATSDVTTLKTITDALEQYHKPAFGLYSADHSTAGTGVSVYPDLTALNAGNIGVVIGQDANGIGASIASTSGKSVGTIGATLGAISKAKVSENIGWIGKFNMVTDTELDSLALTNGTLIRSLNDSALSTLKDKGYIFLRKHVGIDGSYFVDSTTATLSTDDYSNIENGRTMHKAIRNHRSAILPYLNSPIDVNPDGTLTEDFIQYMTVVSQRPLTDMISNGELSAFQVIINPVQNVLSTSNLQITIKLVPKGTARTITVNIGYTVSL